MSAKNSENYVQKISNIFFLVIFCDFFSIENNKHRAKYVGKQYEDIAIRGRLLKIWIGQKRNISEQKLRKKIPSQPPKKRHKNIFNGAQCNRLLLQTRKKSVK